MCKRGRRDNIFGKSDYLKLSVTYYDEKERLIGSSKLIGKKIEVPVKAKKVSIFEYSSETNTAHVINSFYIGTSNTIINLSKQGKSIKLSNKIRGVKTEDISVIKTEVIYKETENEIIITRVLNPGERVFISYSSLQNHINKLSQRVELFFKETNEIKTLIYK